MLKKVKIFNCALLGALCLQGNGPKSVSWLPEGFCVIDAPGDGQCGWWSIVAATKCANGQFSNNVIKVTHAEKQDFLNKVAELLRKKSQSQEESELYNAIFAGDLKKDSYYKCYRRADGVIDWEQLLQALQDEKIQFNDDFTGVIDNWLDCDLVVIKVDNDWQLISSGVKGEWANEEEKSNVPGRQKLRIVYRGDGINGHYLVEMPIHIQKIKYKKEDGFVEKHKVQFIGKK
jgi:hypothetical protein